jgi:hypothetical protein
MQQRYLTSIATSLYYSWIFAPYLFAVYRTAQDHQQEKNVKRRNRHIIGFIRNRTLY